MFMYKISTREFVEMVISTPASPPPPSPDVLHTLLVAHLFRRTLGIMGKVFGGNLVYHRQWKGG